MSEYSNTLREMINNADDEASSIDDATAQIITQIEDLEDQRNGIENAMLDVCANDLSSYLELTKLAEVSGDYVEFGTDYNVANLTDWGIYQLPGPVLVYEYEGTGWDSDSTIIDLIDKWDFGYDYITHPFGITGTYGLQARIDQLYDALDLLLSNKSKIEESKTAFEDFAS